jgi:multiple sugar transport system permease protein
VSAVPAFPLLLLTRRFGGGLAGALLALAAAGARAGWIEDRPDGTTVIHVSVFSLPDPMDATPAVQASAAVVQAFTRRFPALFAERHAAACRADPQRYGRHNWDRVEVALERFSGITVPNVQSDLMAIAGGMAPDILYINFAKSDTYLRNGFLAPLDEYVAAMPPAELSDRVHAKLWPVIRRRGPSGRTRVWALPYGGALGRVLLYRKDLFDRHGIPYPDVNWTWDDMLSACRRIADPKRGIYGCRLERGGAYWLTWLWSAGGEVMTYDEARDEWRCVFGSRAAAVALDAYVRLGTERWVDADGTVRRGYGTIEADERYAVKWTRGELGMMTAYIDENVFATIDPEATGMAPVPLGPTGMRAAELNSQMMGLFAEIREPAVRDAAWEYMRFYEGSEALAIKTRTMVEAGMGRFLNPKLLRRFGYPEIERTAPKEWALAFEAALASGRPEPYGKGSAAVGHIMSGPVSRALALALTDKLPADREQRLAVIEKMLKQAENRANEQLIGVVSPRERRWRRAGAAAVVAGIAIAFGIVFRRVFRPPDAAADASLGARRRREAWAWALALPALLTILVWHYVPLARGTAMAFLDYRLVGKSTFVGLDNFGDLLVDRYWWQAMLNSLRYAGIVVGLTFLPPVILAMALQEVPRGKLAYRLIFYLPAVITGMVTIVLWKQFYAPTETGTANSLVMRVPAVGFLAAGAALLAVCTAFARRLGRHGMRRPAWAFWLAGALLFLAVASLARPILFPPAEDAVASLLRLPGRLFAHLPEPYRWLDDPRTAMMACIVPSVWAGIGPGCLIYLAALKSIPEEYYEAADVDGATPIDKILFVVFPMLRALIVINFVGVFIGAWYSASGNVLLMTGGAADTETAGLHIWFKAFTFLQFGPATAAAWFLAFLMIGFTVHQLKMLARVEFKAQGG